MKNFFGSFSPIKLVTLSLLTLLALLPASAATVVGTVKSSADTSIHVSGAKVVLIVSNVHMESTTTDSVGNYRLDSVATGNAKSLQATKAGFAPTTSANFNITTAQANSTITQNINLQLYGNISGTIRKSSDSTVLANVLMLLRRGTSTAIVDSVRSNGSGIFNFLNVAPGTPTYTVTASAATYLDFTSSALTVTSGASTALNVYMVTAIPGTITGTVRKLADTTFRIASAQVVLRRGSATATIIDSAISDSLGHYTFHNVAPGSPNYWISASASGYISASNTNVTLGNGATVVSNLGLGSPGTITGNLTNTVTADIIVPITNALMLLRRGSDTASIIDSTRTNSQGVYTFHNVAPGTPNYWITAVTSIGSKTNANVAGTSGGTTTSNFAFIQTVSIFRPITNSSGLQLIRIGDHLVINLEASSATRVIEAYTLTGAIYGRVTIPAGETRATLPAAFAEAKSLLFKVK